MKPRIHFNPERWPDEFRALSALDIAGAQVIGFDFEDSAKALGEMVMARRRGVPVAVMAVYREPLETMWHNITASIAATNDADLRARQISGAILETLVLEGNKRPEELAKNPPGIGNVSAFTVRMADVLLLSTPAEVQRFERLSENVVLRSAVLDPPPAATAPQGDGVVLYAPTLLRAQLGGYEYALKLRSINAQIIAAENARDTIRGKYIVLPEWWRGLTARSLANAGYKVIVPRQNGAESFHPAIAVFEARNLYSIGESLDRAFAQPPCKAQLTTVNSIASVLEDDRALPANGGLVSIVVRTANRPQFLRRALLSIARQTYRDLEVVLVNNAGDDISELARVALGEVPLRYIALGAPVDVGVALNAGARATTGEFVGYLDDDDILYPDHVARCVYSLQQSHGDLVYANCVGEYAQMADGVKQVLAMQVYTDNEYSLDDLHIGNIATIHGVVHRRSLFEKFGYFDESLPVTEDWELWLRVAVGGARIVRLNRATCEYSWRVDPTNPNTSVSRLKSFADAYETIVALYAAHTDQRKLTIGQKQARSLEHQRARAQAVLEDPGTAIHYVMNDLLPPAVPVEGLSDEL